MSGKSHWDDIYRRKAPDEVSWYQPHLERSLDLVAATGLPKNAAVIDVGGGPSTFADDLLARGYTNLTVVDLSDTALRMAQERLGSRAATVRWIQGDITRLELPEAAFDFWHDRAVFHFLVEEEPRRRYVDAVRRALRPGGHIVVATFGTEGPLHCSGLEVSRYDVDSLHAQFGTSFEKVASFQETHVTPAGNAQEFVYCYCRRSA